MISGGKNEIKEKQNVSNSLCMNFSICICMQIKIALLRNICEVIHDRHAVQQKQDCVLPSHWSACHEYSLCRTLGAV